MENETDNIIESQNDELELDLELEEETPEEAPAEEKPAEKPKETPEAKLARLKRQIAQTEKQLGIKETLPETKSNVHSKSNELGYAEKAFILANDIKLDEMHLVKEFMANTGKPLDEVVVNKYFLNELKDFRDSKASKEAVPQGNKRSTSTPRDSVDYWIKKPFNEVPQEMRSQVVNKRLEMEKTKNPFA